MCGPDIESGDAEEGESVECFGDRRGQVERRCANKIGIVIVEIIVDFDGKSLILQAGVQFTIFGGKGIATKRACENE